MSEQTSLVDALDQIADRLEDDLAFVRQAIAAASHRTVASAWLDVEHSETKAEYDARVRRHLGIDNDGVAVGVGDYGGREADHQPDLSWGRVVCANHLREEGQPMSEVQTSCAGCDNPACPECTWDGKPSPGMLTAWLVDHLDGHPGDEHAPMWCGHCHEEWEIRSEGIEAVTLRDLAMEQAYEESLYETCPEHGRQEIVAHGSTGGPDPYAVQKLACGDAVTCFGPGEDNLIVGWRAPLW